MFEKLYSELLEKLDDGDASALVSFMSARDSVSGSILDKKLLSLKDLKNKSLSEDLQPLAETIDTSFSTGLPQSKDLNGKLVLVEPYFPKPRLIIFGGGHIAKPLSELGANSEFAVTVVDDRPMFANSARFPDAETIICDSFENAFDKVKLRSSDFVVVVTRGHAHDGVCIRKALAYDLDYLGMIGSKRRVSGVMKQLREENFPLAQIEKISSPIGLDIGAVTPFEIAVSIIAEIIEYRRHRSDKSDDIVRNKKFKWPEFDKDVLESMCSTEDTPKALVTIISSKGSVPRKAGAKMIVYQDGRLLGSIGGGCSEAGIISIARDLILEKGYRIEPVDMTGEVAEDLGMVCGGVMDVLIESF